jgi:hypothetical protein
MQPHVKIGLVSTPELVDPDALPDDMHCAHVAVFRAENEAINWLRQKETPGW